jgi:hypothetical protein
MLMVITAVGFCIVIGVSKVMGLKVDGSYFQNFLSKSLEQKDISFIKEIMSITACDVVEVLLLYFIKLVGLVFLQIFLIMALRNKSLALIIPIFLYTAFSFLPQWSMYIPLGTTMYIVQCKLI